MTQGKGLGGGAILLHSLAKHWWLLLLRGIAAIIFGVLAFMSPLIVGISLVILYGAYVLVDGVFSIFAAISGGTPAPRWWLALVGILGILAGLIAFAQPALVALYLVIFIGAMALVSGIFEIIGAIRLRKEIDNEWMLILHGLLTALFGIVLMAMPVKGGLALVWVMGAYTIAAGIIMSALAFKLKSHAR